VLCRCVLDGSVVILRAEPACIAHGGFVPTRKYADDQDGDLAQRIKAYADRSVAHRADFARYTQAVDDRVRAAKTALAPIRHIETIVEAGARNRAARAASGGLAALVSSVESIASAGAPSFPALTVSPEERGIPDLGAGRTPLGSATPFELGDIPSFGDSFDIAKTPNRGEPGTWYTNPGSGQMRL